MQFAAMVGSNMLTRPSHGAGWLTKFKQSMKASLNPGGRSGAGRKAALAHQGVREKPPERS
jgi:TetR/AcrR family transcriptional repressor of nem operon